MAGHWRALQLLSPDHSPPSLISSCLRGKGVEGWGWVGRTAFWTLISLTSTYHYDQPVKMKEREIVYKIPAE